MRSISSARAVSITMGMCRVAASDWSFRHTSVPGMSGSIRSSSTSDGNSVRASSSASRPVVAVSVLKPSRSSRYATLWTTSSSSSTMRIRSVTPLTVPEACVRVFAAL
jgi:hypothetical protein